jgi:hypothetical protein
MRILALQRRSYVGLEFAFVTLYVCSATAAECGSVVEWLSLDATGGNAVERAICGRLVEASPNLDAVERVVCCAVISSGKAVVTESASRNASIEPVPPTAPRRP